LFSEHRKHRQRNRHTAGEQIDNSQREYVCVRDRLQLTIANVCQSGECVGMSARCVNWFVTGVDSEMFVVITVCTLHTSRHDGQIGDTNMNSQHRSVILRQSGRGAGQVEGGHCVCTETRRKGEVDLRSRVSCNFDPTIHNHRRR
jgi:hypothetical protein